MLGDDGLFGRNWDVFMFFLRSMFLFVAFGLLMLILRLIIFRKSKSKKFQTNFFYTLSGLFNFWLFIIWIIAISTKLLKICQRYLFAIVGLSLIISIFIFIDIFKASRFEKQ
jgi:hypothetical protein